VEEASELIVSGYGKKWNGKGAHKRLGKRPLESAASLIQDYDLPCTPQELHSQILAFMKNRHANSSDPSFFFYSQLFFALLPQNPSFLSCSIGFFPVGITCWNEYCWLAGALRERSLSIWWCMTDWLTDQPRGGGWGRGHHHQTLASCCRSIDGWWNWGFIRWAQARALPGANRLVTHLHSRGVPFAIASSSPAKNIKAKLSYQAGMYVFMYANFNCFCFLAIRQVSSWMLEEMWINIHKWSFDEKVTSIAKYFSLELYMTMAFSSIRGVWKNGPKDKGHTDWGIWQYGCDVVQVGQKHLQWWWQGMRS